MKAFAVLVTCILGLSLQANARHLNLESVLVLDQAMLGGSGCQGGSGRLIVTGRHELQLSSHGLTSVADSVHPLNRKACAVTIPFDLPPGQRLVVSDVAMVGHVQLHNGAQTELNAEVFTAGSLGPKLSRAYKAPARGTVAGRVVAKGAGITTACGAAGQLRLNVSQVLRSKKAASQVSLKRTLLGLRLEACAR